MSDIQPIRVPYKFMRICHVITRLIIGGAQENTVLTCRGLVERGHDVTLISGPETGPEGSLWPQARAVGCTLITVNALRRAVHPFRDFRARRDLTRLFRQLDPDVVHTHSSKAGILARHAAAAAHVPTIIHTIHGMSFNRTQTRATQSIYRCLERRAARHTTALISVADAMTQQAIDAGLAPPERFTTIRSGMDVDRFAPDAVARARWRDTWGARDGVVVVGTVARLFDDKGYDEIIAAMPHALQRHPNLLFVWVGDGARRSEYERRLADAGLRDRVRTLGLLPPEQVASVINGFDMLVHASRWEGLPRAVVQALLTEVPAISFDNDGAPEVVIPGETGSLVRCGDVAGLAQAIADMAGDPEGKARMGRTGRERCIVEFDWRTMVARIERLYEACRGQVHDSLPPFSESRPSSQ